MVFSSSLFLFVFLPIVLTAYRLTPRVGKNLLLILVSLFFYAWGEGKYVLFMLFSIGLNYLFALALDRQEGMRRKWLLSVGIVVNLLPLLYFKYTHFFLSMFSHVWPQVEPAAEMAMNIHLPIGISFFTFEAISYLVDVYRRQIRAERNPMHLALYISFFPHLIAGPIIRYKDLLPQMKERQVSREQFSQGVRRFIIGLGKKVLIANTMATVADQIFGLPTWDLSTGAAWLGIIAYTIQIYADFSGYSDMAIGLAHMFGFRLLENFQYPYWSQSIRDFWRRWHISLSAWFRDYVYIPLGGNHSSRAMVAMNILIVFFLCGLWHGAALTFIFFGLWHGLFLVLEHFFSLKDRRLPIFLLRLYTLLIVMIGWVFFRSPSLTYAFGYLLALVPHGDGGVYSLAVFLNKKRVLMILVGILSALPILPWLRERLKGLSTALGDLSLVVVFVLALMAVMSGTYNPFIYFRF